MAFAPSISIRHTAGASLHTDVVIVRCMHTYKYVYTRYTLQRNYRICIEPPSSTMLTYILFPTLAAHVPLKPRFNWDCSCHKCPCYKAVVFAHLLASGSASLYAEWTASFASIQAPFYRNGACLSEFLSKGSNTPRVRRWLSFAQIGTR